MENCPQLQDFANAHRVKPEALPSRCSGRQTTPKFLAPTVAVFPRAKSFPQDHRSDTNRQNRIDAVQQPTHRASFPACAKLKSQGLFRLAANSLLHVLLWDKHSRFEDRNPVVSSATWLRDTSCISCRCHTDMDRYDRLCRHDSRWDPRLVIPDLAAGLLRLADRPVVAVGGQRRAWFP